MQQNILTSLVALMSSVFMLSHQAGAHLMSRSNAGDLKALCSGQQVDLRTVRHLKLLANNLDTSGETCSDRIKAAVRRLAEITDDRKACTNDKAEAILGFVQEYLRNTPNDPHQSSNFEALPEPLVNFFVAYGMRVSGICQRFMLNRFSREAEVELEKRYKDQLIGFQSWLIRGSPLSLILFPIIKTGEIILPSDLMEVVPGMEPKMEKFLTSDQTMANLKAICKNELQPLYEPTLLPLAKLIRAGFNNRDLYYRRKFKDDGRFWSVAVFLCETLKGIQVAQGEPGELSDSEQATIKSDMRQVAESLAEADLQEPAERGNEQPEVNEVTTKPDDVLIPDEVIDGTILGRFDFATKSLVRHFDANKDERERLKERILERSFLVFKRMSMKFKHKKMWRKFFKNLLFMKNSNKDFERARDGLLELMEAPDGVSVSYQFKTALELLGMLLPFIFASLIAFLALTPMWLLDVPEKKIRNAGHWIYGWV